MVRVLDCAISHVLTGMNCFAEYGWGGSGFYDHESVLRADVLSYQVIVQYRYMNMSPCSGKSSTCTVC